MTTVDDGYELLDSGHGRKLERFGGQVLERPCPQAVWRSRLDRRQWTARADASFGRGGREGSAGSNPGWMLRRELPERWTVVVDGLRFALSRTPFGQVGLFPEQRVCWWWAARRIEDAARRRQRRPEVLNLFAYTGGATLAAARAGAALCHLDASRPTVGWARDNAELNDLGAWPVRWIVDDALKFLGREDRRGRRYDGVILDPPSFGRGAKGEIYKIEDALTETLLACARVLSEEPLFVLLSSHTPGYTPDVLSTLLRDTAPSGGGVEAGEMSLTGAADVPRVPSGAWAGWSASAEA